MASRGNVLIIIISPHRFDTHTEEDKKKHDKHIQLKWKWTNLNEKKKIWIKCAYGLSEMKHRIWTKRKYRAIVITSGYWLNNKCLVNQFDLWPLILPPHTSFTAAHITYLSHCRTHSVRIRNGKCNWKRATTKNFTFPSVWNALIARKLRAHT